MKYLLSLMLIVTMTCKDIEIKGKSFWGKIYRCENDEVVCYYVFGDKKGGLSCKFKEQEQ